MTTVFQRVGPFQILRQIGEGGMAWVFLAEDTRTQQQVALKLVPTGNREILEAERYGARLQEALAAECPMVPRVFETGDIPSHYFIAMEYVDGENLSDLVARGPVDPDRAAAIASQICRFLDVAHRFDRSVDGRQVSLVHGDLKPGNVRVTSSGEIRILDFGIAKALSLSRKVTRNDFGSLPYMSPERIDSVDSEVDSAVDLWALGVILYEMLNGGRPFHAADTRRLERRIRGGYPRQPLPDTVPVGYRAITARLLSPAQAARYASARDVLDDLEQALAGSTTNAEQQGFPGRLDEVVTRRTRRSEDVEATRRTRPEAEVASAGVTAPVSLLAFLADHLPRVTVRGVLLVAALLIVLNEAAVGIAARGPAGRARMADHEAMSALWADHERLSGRSFLGMGVARLERALRARALALANQAIANYRNPALIVFERQWETAHENLARAVVLSPGDRQLRAALKYCEGHIERINGAAARERKNRGAANQRFTNAVTAFREAAELRPGWPDPFLGLARTFIGLEDMDRAADAITQAQQRGLTVGEREIAQLGDGYRARGEMLRQTARELVHLPQEAEYLQRALAAYRDALAQYERIQGLPGIATSLRRVHLAMGEISARLAELSAASRAGEI